MVEYFLEGLADYFEEAVLFNLFENEMDVRQKLDLVLDLAEEEAAVVCLAEILVHH